MKKVIIGIGDDFYSDDAIGLVLLRKLKADKIDKEWTLVEEGKRSFNIIDYIDSYDKILIIDAVRMGMGAGEFRLFRFTDIKPKINMEIISFHQFGLAENILLAESLGKDISKIFIFGIEPEILGYGDRLSDKLKSNINIYILKIKEFMYN